MSKSSTTTKAIATPNRVTAHPGEVLNEEFLKPLGMSVDALAIALRVAVTRIGAIVKGERSVAAETALRLARFYGTSSEFWMNLQALHDLTKTRIENGKAIARDVRQRTARVHSPSACSPPFWCIPLQPTDRRCRSSPSCPNSYDGCD